MKLFAPFIFVALFSACSTIHDQKETSPLDGAWILTDFSCDQGPLSVSGMQLQKDIQKHVQNQTLYISGHQARAITIAYGGEDGKIAPDVRCEEDGSENLDVDSEKHQITFSKTHVKSVRVNTKRDWCQDFSLTFPRTQQYELSGDTLKIIITSLIPIPGWDGKTDCTQGRMVNTYKKLF